MKKIGQRNVVLPAALLDLPMKISALCKNEGKLVDIIVNQKYKLLTSLSFFKAVCRLFVENFQLIFYLGHPSHDKCL
jgi:hypothetical protein